MPRGRFQSGTTIRREFDLTRFREAVKDFRHWVSYGIVATVDDAGNVDDATDSGIVIRPDGIAVDVILYPAEEPVTCRYCGIQGGPEVTIYAPIHAGDEVLVAIPDGEISNPPVIVNILNSGAAKLPREADGKPVFRNDRLSIFASTVPIEIRTPRGSIRVNPDGRITLGDQDATEQLLLATTYREAQATEDTSLIAEIGAAGTALSAAGVAPNFTAAKPFLAAAGTALTSAIAAINAFEARAAEFVSTQVFTK